MNDTPQKPSSIGSALTTGWTRTLVLVLLCCLLYLAVVVADYVCVTRHVYDWRTGLFVIAALGVVTFVMAALALFKPQSKQV